MRVVSGSARGKQLQPVPGMETRPTTDRVKESIFNIIQMQVREARILDLFAGTGQLGIEALSRGAAHADFVEKDRAAIAVIRKNLQSAQVKERASVHHSDFMQYLSTCASQSVDLLFLDPPYGGQLLEDALFQIERFDILSPDGIIICESAVEDEWTCAYSRAREYRYGATRISILSKDTKPNSP